MTLVEFFDGVSIHNMVSCLTMKPEKVVFLGERKLMLEEETIYKRFIKQQNLEVEFDFRSIQRNSLEQILTVLEDLVMKEENCVFDLTGGDDLLLVAMGIVSERYKKEKKILMHRFNIKSGALADCDNDGILPDAETPKISAADNIMLYGGCIVPRHGDNGTYPWEFDNDFVNDLMHMWEICRVNPGLWNAQINTISQMVKSSEVELETLDIHVDKMLVQNDMRKGRNKFVWAYNIINQLKCNGLICNLIETDSCISFSFKNSQVKECLTKAGNLLELIVTCHAQNAIDNKGNAIYNDVVTGAFIDWDSELHELKDPVKDTTNEIDVILMKGLVPIFVSCKNGFVDQAELYKLHTVAEHFGGPYAKKVLICTYYGNDPGAGHQYFLQRAKDMDIRVIENVHELSNEDFYKKIKNI